MKYRANDIIPDCFEQKATTEDDKVHALLYVLLRRDNRLLPQFYDALEYTDQKYITDILRQNVRQQQQQQQEQQGEHVFLIIVCLHRLSFWVHRSF